MKCIYVSILAFFLGAILSVTAQTIDNKSFERCATMTILNKKFEKNPAFKQRFEQERTKFNQAVQKGVYRLSGAARGSNDPSNARTIHTIPVVFHIVLKNQSLVTDAQIQAQLDVLNRDFAGINADSTRIPSYFKSFFGKSAIQFVLAQRTPTGGHTTGIERVTTNSDVFAITNSDIKYTVDKGTDSWDVENYYNVWICALDNYQGSTVFGYSTFPNDSETPKAEQGTVIDYRCLPNGSYTNYNAGRTLTHETGHFFNLFHIWGDDDGACFGTDYVEDTPNQADASSGCYSGIRRDVCTSNNGIMYQNYMDYSADACLVMFTNGQVSRMESTLAAYRSTLLTSDGGREAVITNNNAEIRSITNPLRRLCTDAFRPVITLRNRGNQVLTSLVITTQIDDQVVSTYNWTGSLTKTSTSTVTLNSVPAQEGEHTVKIRLSLPNGKTDEEITNDTLSTTYQYYNPVTTIVESFEDNTFPAPGWFLVNNDLGITWRRIEGIAHTGNASVVINNYDYSSNDERDDLQLPSLNIAEVDSAYLSFYVAAATYTPINTRNNVWDTLQVLVSTDCGKTYTSLYKKYGGSLVTRTTATEEAFIPASTEWRKDSINLSAYIGNENLLVAFRNTTEFENNIYLDDINIRTVKINDILKERGYVIASNGSGEQVSVEFYPQPVGLERIVIYSLLGQKVAEANVQSNSPSSSFKFDLSPYASGIYIVHAVFGDHITVKKILKY